MRRAALGKRVASFVGKLSAFTLVRPMRRSTVRSPLGKDRKMEQGGIRMRATPALTRAPNGVNDAGKKCRETASPSRPRTDATDRTPPVNRAEPRRSSFARRRLKHRASIRPSLCVRPRPSASVRPSLRRSCVPILRPSVPSSAPPPALAKAGEKYRATEGRKEGRRWKEREERRQSEKSGDGGDGGGAALPVQSVCPSSCVNECFCPHVIRVLSFPTVLR